MSKKTKIKENWSSTDGLPKWNQSPVDLNRAYVLHQKFPPLHLQGHLSNKGYATMTNTGTTVKIELEGDRTACLKGGPLAGEYQFSELQFRWGRSDARGAEHSVEGTWFSMEAQAVHWNTNYGSIDKCYEKDDGIAIIAFFLQVIGCPSMLDNPNFSCITDSLSRIRIPGTSVKLTADCLNWIEDAFSEPGYYTYNGSLTTYPFSECVTWIVVPRPIKISAKQADKFRNLYDYKAEPILRNYRSQHKLRKRNIFFATADDY